MSFTAYTIDTSSDHLVVVVGMGLVGSAIANSIKHHADEEFIAPAAKFNWENHQELTLPIKKLVESLGAKTLELVWAAGTAGFSATDEVMQAEFDYYQRALDELSKIKRIGLRVNLISSAGGLYENSGFVTSIDDISPSRPYANYKYRQEQLLSHIGLPHRIYRVATVYGSGGRREGLINNLVNEKGDVNPTIIYAHQNTMRDYVYSKDIGNQIVADIIGSTNSPTSIKILATGRAISINTLLNTARRVRRRPCIVSFRPDSSNDKDIIFMPSLLTPCSTTPVEQGMKELYRLFQSNGK